MPWKKAGPSGHRYFYRRDSIPGRRHYTCLGRGSAAHLAAEKERQANQQALIERAERTRYRHELDRLAQALRELSLWGELLTRASLLIDGFYDHHKGEWRRRRDYGPGS